MRSARHHPEVVAAARENGPQKGLWLVSLAAFTALVLVSVVFVRALTTNQQSRQLCEKIDRFIVASEKLVQASTLLTPAEKRMRIRFYEEFRNDPPTCRTPGP